MPYRYNGGQFKTKRLSDIEIKKLYNSYV